MTDRASRSTIERDDMMAPLLAACPSFTPAWQAFLTEWVDNPILLEDGGDGALPMYLALNDLADHLVRKLEMSETDEFPATFGVVETWITDGSHYVSEAAVVGLLEDLLAEHHYRSSSPKDFLPWLGPQSSKWWFEVGDFWDRLAAGKFRPLSIY